MTAATSASTTRASHRLCFAALGGGRAFDFPCDAEGRVDLDGLSERARNDYFFARALIGVAVAWPTVRQAD